MSHWLNQSILNNLTSPEPRLPYLEAWLLQGVWTEARFQEQDGKPSEYLKSGEGLVNEMEKLLSSTASFYFTELCATPTPPKSVSNFFAQHEKGCVVVLDGCSLREIPRLAELAKLSRRPVVETSCGRSAIPSTTEHFIGDRLGLGLPAMGPSRLASRRELKERGIAFYYFQSPNEHQAISDEAEHIIIWHRFPDRRYLDSTASTLEFYDSIWDTLGLVWKRTAQALPPSRPLLVTSDHGYLYLGSGLSDTRLDGKDRPMKGKRFREFPEKEPLPEESPELFVDRQRRLAVIKGRCHNHPQAPSPSQSLYRHEGISLMEVLTPWLVLGPMEVKK